MLLATVSLWALNFTVSKYILDHGFRPLAYSSVRYACAAIIFAAITLAWEGSLRISRRELQAARLPELRFRRPGLGRLRLRGARAARAHKPALVHGDRPRRPVARVFVREPAAVSRGDRRAPAPLGKDHGRPGRGRSSH